MERLNGFSSGRKFVYHAHVEVAVNGHGQRTRNGGGCHHKDMGRTNVLLPQPRALLHAEAVLLVDDHEAEIEEGYGGFYECMCTYKNMNRAVGHALQYFATFLSLHVSRKQSNAKIQPPYHFADGLEMLLGQDFGRSHDAGLKAVVHG